jgi:predicted ATP-dependent endonuclease of OLD family
MRINKLILKNFGPFRNFEVQFLKEEEICLLLTGKNNEGKSTIINALRLLDAATRVINQKRQSISIEGDEYFKLLQQDTESHNIKRMVYNYEDTVAEIHGHFLEDDLKIIVYLDPVDNLIYAEHFGHIPFDVKQIFGFVPPLGPLNESEDIISNIPYLRASINTSLAPRHLRNHFFQILTADEFTLVRKIINSSWKGIELLDYEPIYKENKVFSYYKENRVERELAWAGQGLQVWFQIITHLVRLRNTSILILDEPEINLHPEKQNDLIRILREYYNGSILIATHSVELMNNVHISHIINVNKGHSRPKIKSTEDKFYLEFVRSQVGSNFNLIASQFEDVDILIFTEDTDDFTIINELAKGYGINKKAFNIPVYGFSEYKKAIFYKKAYELLLGKKAQYSILLDRDYYPTDYLQSVSKELEHAEGIRTVFTPGKEIENIFLYPQLLFKIIPASHHVELKEHLQKVFDELCLDCRGSYVSLYQHFMSGRIDTKSLIKSLSPKFDKLWNDKKSNFKFIAGKSALKSIRGFYRDQFRENLTRQHLMSSLIKLNIPEVRKFIDQLYQTESL